MNRSKQKLWMLSIFFILGMGWCATQLFYPNHGRAPKFSVGDCFVSENEPKDSWLTVPSTYKVVEVGVESYRLTYAVVEPRLSNILGTQVSGGQKFIWDDGYKKVPCP